MAQTINGKHTKNGIKSTLRKPNMNKHTNNKNTHILTHLNAYTYTYIHVDPVKYIHMRKGAQKYTDRQIHINTLRHKKGHKHTLTHTTKTSQTTHTHMDAHKH